MEDTVIKAEGLCKSYKMFKKSADRWLDVFLPFKKASYFKALRDVDLEVKAGESVGLVGLNGSGKTTLSNLIAGVSRPSAGTLEVKGRTTRTSVGVGLNPQLTGIENIEMKGLLIGLKSKEIKALMPQIIEFAEIEDFIDQPVKTYSSGMRSRLSFAISINVNPDIMVVDEGLSVGDLTFVDKCLNWVKTFRKSGKTMIFTSHSADQVKSFCDRIVWIEGGKVKMDGPATEVLAEYNGFIKWYKGLSEADQKAFIKKLKEDRMGVR